MGYTSIYMSICVSYPSTNYSPEALPPENLTTILDTSSEGEVIRMGINVRNALFGAVTAVVLAAVGVLGAAQWLADAGYTDRWAWVAVAFGVIAIGFGLLVNVGEGNGPLVTVAGVCVLAFGVAVLGAAEWLVNRNLDTNVGLLVLAVGAVAGLLALNANAPHEPHTSF